MNMKRKFTVVNDGGRYFLYEDGKKYTTPCCFNISSLDKELVEVIGRKIAEGKPTLVNRYLCKYDNDDLVSIIRELSDQDGFWARFEIVNNPALCARVFKNIQLRNLIDAYSECGSVNLAINVTANDAEEDFDPFMAGMAMTSGLSLSAAGEAASMFYEELCDYFEYDEDKDVSEILSKSYLEYFVDKYNALLVPKGEKARSKYWDLLYHLSVNPEDVVYEDDDDWDDDDDNDDDSGDGGDDEDDARL